MNQSARCVVKLVSRLLDVPVYVYSMCVFVRFGVIKKDLPFKEGGVRHLGGGGYNGSDFGIFPNTNSRANVLVRAYVSVFSE